MYLHTHTVQNKIKIVKREKEFEGKGDMFMIPIGNEGDSFSYSFFELFKEC